MSRSRIISKLIIPIALFTIYSITLYKTATSPVEPASIEGNATQTTANLQSVALVDENDSDIPRPPQAPEALTTASNNPDILRFVVLTDPQMVPASQATWLKPDDAILGIVKDGHAQAFPLAQMAFHHVINSKVAGEPYLITYCFLCGGHAQGFTATIGGVRYTFDVYGIYDNSLALIDRQTASVWNQADGKPLSGPMAVRGISLQPYVITQGTWGEWTRLYPDTTVLPQFPDYAKQYSQISRINVDSESQISALLNKDARLPSDTVVLGANINSLYRAYLIDDAEGTVGMLSDSLDGVPLVIFFDGKARFGKVFQAILDDRVLSFSIKDNRIIDSTGSVWNSSGLAIGGPYSGRQLLPIASLLTEWSSWSLYHPETSIYGE